MEIQTLQDAIRLLEEALTLEQVSALNEKVDVGFTADVPVVQFTDVDWVHWTEAVRRKVQLLDRLFSGVYPCGIVYADRYREKGGDYARLAFLAYDTLQLRVEEDCPVELRALIETDAAAIQAKRGQLYQVSTSGQTVMLGSKASS